ncbi:MAG: glycosyltransferase [Anaerolineae bacterium]
MPKPQIAILHYSAPPVIGGVESTIEAQARLLADYGYPVKILAGRGAGFDARVPLELTPTLDSTHAFVLQVQRKLAVGSVSGDFHALTAAIHRHLTAQFQGIDVCIVHNALTLHKNLALTNALHELARTRSLRLIGWCHDFAWTDPLYVNELHAGVPWNLLREKWEGVQYVVVSADRRQELARLLNAPEQAIVVAPPGLDCFGFGETRPACAISLGEPRGIHSHEME